ncbi:hypothetical protein A1O3_02287 [Capronia epimyces CBS 606.96]|uniref:Zn(2)-C6 fungal-type domain-containing protein n=1 Tax=Capronia epimyces CBS 606.96 TaxID=1182542 RepID=W9YIY6_9EURO|nr:uncharacterized protein A1O3_02287 [Capronia epimyces CBS 606.96]EXJ89221.1 hypothetical protein A1O3_02287 [Capronia epimyces CBS 606.96]
MQAQARPLTTTNLDLDPRHDSARPEPSAMAYACQPCVRRKVKCDRAIPICSSCKQKFDCVYQAPPPRQPKRKRSETVYERLARYERTLQENGLLSKADSTTVAAKETMRSGKLLSGEGKARYIDGSLWRDLGENDMLEMSEEEEDDPRPPPPVGIISPTATTDLLSSALLGTPQDLVDYHPGHEDAMKLWAVYVDNVEPLCKLLHVPTVARMVERVSRQPGTASKAQECLLFAIYHFAVFSLADGECVRAFGQSQAALLAKYQNAVRKALVNASWLKTTAMPVMQAYVLFLTALRTQIDPHTFWILTGVAVRIAQRMGLHRDGESLGLPPFDVQMRRRLFWQLLPLDGYAGQVSGTGISTPPTSWDTKQPCNIHDDQIFPGMTQQPEEEKGATEMIYCLSRSELTKLYTRTGVKMKEVGATLQLRDTAELDRLIDEVEGTIELKYLRYCDIADPLHFLTLGMVRSAANIVRLHSRMSRLMNKGLDDHERRQLCALAHKILDTDSAAYSHPKMNRFHWSFRSFFLGDALICLLTSLAKVGFFSRPELDATWHKMAHVYSNHREFLEAKRAIHIAVGKVTLKAWRANPPTHSGPEPDFIDTLRSSLPKINPAKRPNPKKTRDTVGGLDALDGGPEAMSTLFSSPSSDAGALFGGLDGTDVNLDQNFNLDATDWMFWDQLTRDYETMPT